MCRKLLSMMGMARKAGKLEGGYDVSVDRIKEGKAALVMASRDISDKTYKNLEFHAHKAGVLAIRLEVSMQEIGDACGFRAGVAVVTDSGFADAITGLAVGSKRRNAYYDD